MFNIDEDTLRNGYTTGTCAAAAVKVGLNAIINNEIWNKVEISTLNGINLTIPVERVIIKKNYAICAIRKFSGDDPDVTDGIYICAKVKIVDTLPNKDKAQYFKKCLIVGGRGVGVVTKKGLQIAVGKSAINPGPLKMINDVIEKFLNDSTKKAIVTIFVPEGKKKSSQTYNPKMGIIGGISILGTTGIVKPMSEDALKRSMFAELKVMKMNSDKDWIIFAFGNYGKAYCERLGIDTNQVIIISNFVGYMIESAVKLGYTKIILLGHISKAIKIAGGIFNTHSRIADARNEIMAINAYIIGESSEIIHKILESNTIEEACEYVTKYELYNLIANKISKRMKEYSRADIEVAVSLFSFSGETIGRSDNFNNFLERCICV